jgi:hypothetical protein
MVSLELRSNKTLLRSILGRSQSNKSGYDKLTLSEYFRYIR